MVNHGISSFLFFSSITIFLFGFGSSLDTTTSHDIESKNLPVVSDQCKQQSAVFASLNKPKSFGQEMHLESEKSMLQLTWTGANHEKILIISSSDVSNTVWLSEADNSFKNISNLVFKDTSLNINKLNIHLFTNPLDSKTTYIWAQDNSNSFSSELFITTDSAVTFTKVNVNFPMTSEGIMFHPSNPDLILALDTYNMKLYLSKDKGFNWKFLDSDVNSAKWSKNPSVPNDIFIVKNDQVKTMFFGLFKIVDPKFSVLYRIENLTQPGVLLKKKVYGIGSEDIFLYASIMVDENERHMQVSSDGGRTWNRVQLPSITPDRFYSIMDISDGVILLHVDNPGDTGRGILYTSDATGILFSKSLENHMFPNYDRVMDFYKVHSSNGTYITSILGEDDSVKTVISYDRGSEWHPITRPAGVPCHNESGECTLHIHYLFSQSHGIKTASPLSVPNAPGLIIAHGHVAEALQQSTPDVYVSNDGGHNWIFALKGPHTYQIADSGNLIIAVPLSTPDVDTFYFSTDRGRCWTSHKFTDEKLLFKALLVTPDNLESSLTIWGFTQNDKKWHSFVFDFASVITNKCTSDDFEEWRTTSHQGEECLLGSTSTFIRPKPGARCLNQVGFSSLIYSKECQCTKEDYTCDYGYVRVGEDCQKDVNFLDNINICLRNHQQEFVPVGYHKIPGDKCVEGYQPEASSYVDMKKTCSGVAGSRFSESYRKRQQFEMQKAKQEVQESKNRKVIIFAIFFFLGIILIVVFVLTARKYKLFKRQPKYKYSSIRADEDESVRGSLMEDDDDDSRINGGFYQKLSGDVVEITNENHKEAGEPKEPQAGYIHPKLLALTNPHLAPIHAKPIGESDVEMIE